ncbi:MAG: right-handed parallel beta-helix repeat-containing protein [Opitutales bacterium]
MLHVNQAHPEARDHHSSGQPDLPFVTIAAAAQHAEPGDTIRVHAGTYRERVAPPRGGEPDAPITYEAAPGEDVIISASERWQPDWEPGGDNPNLLIGRMSPHLFGRYNPYTVENAGREDTTLGQLFVDGRPLLELPIEDREAVAARPGSFCVIDDARALLVHFPEGRVAPADRKVELTVRERNFAPYLRGLGHIVVRGFIMEHAGNQFPRGFWSSDNPQAGALGARGGHHWVMEHNTIRYAHNVGIDIGSEGRVDADGMGQPQPEFTGKHVVRHNHIHDNGGAGIVGIRSLGTEIVGNVIERNVSLAPGGPENSGIKVHFFIGGLIADNLIRDNGASGIWIDNVWPQSRITRNVLIGNTGAAIFVEMGFGPVLIDNNILALTVAGASLAGDGLYTHDSSDAIFVHNLVYGNANYGLWLHRATDRTTNAWTDELAAWWGEDPFNFWREPGFEIERLTVQADNWHILNNLFIMNHRGDIAMPPESEDASNNVSDYNLFAGSYNRETSETYAEGQDAPLFNLISNKERIPLAELKQTFTEGWEAAGIPAEDRPNLEAGYRLPQVGLELWTAATGFEANSRFVRVLRPDLSPGPGRHELFFFIDDQAADLGAPKINGVDHDFNGLPIDPDKVLPGPFQDLTFAPSLNDRSNYKQGRGPYNDVDDVDEPNRYQLWPLVPRSWPLPLPGIPE